MDPNIIDAMHSTPFDYPKEDDDNGEQVVAMAAELLWIMLSRLSQSRTVVAHAIWIAIDGPSNYNIAKEAKELGVSRQRLHVVVGRVAAELDAATRRPIDEGCDVLRFKATVKNNAASRQRSNKNSGSL